MPPDHPFGDIYLVKHHHAVLMFGQEIRFGAVDTVFSDCRNIHTINCSVPMGYVQSPYPDCEGRWFRVTRGKDREYVELTEIEAPTTTTPKSTTITLSIIGTDKVTLSAGDIITFDDSSPLLTFIAGGSFGVDNHPDIKLNVPYRVVSINQTTLVVEEVDKVVDGVKLGEMIGTVKYMPGASGMGQFAVGSSFKFGTKDPLNPDYNRVLSGATKRFISCGVTIKMDVGSLIPSDDIYIITRIYGDRWTVVREEPTSPSTEVPMCRWGACLAKEGLDVNGRCLLHTTCSYDSPADYRSNTSTSTTSTNQETTNMNGQVYTGHVVKTKTIQAGEGVHSGVQKSEIVFTTSRPVIAASIGAAKNIILALAARQDSKLDLENPTEILEVVVVAAS